MPSGGAALSETGTAGHGLMLPAAGYDPINPTDDDALSWLANENGADPSPRRSRRVEEFSISTCE